MFWHPPYYRHPRFREGVIAQLAIAPGVAAWGLMTGVGMVKLGLGVTAFVRLDAENTGQATQRLEEALAKLTQVVSCHYISGEGTFELHVVATDLDAFSRFALGQLINLPGVKDIHTSFSLGEIKSQTAVPLDHLKTV